MVHIPVDLSDGQWHTVELDRNGREAELSIDSSYTALGVSPGVHAILNVETEEIFFGSEVDVFPNGFRDISKGFEVRVWVFFTKRSPLVDYLHPTNLALISTRKKTTLSYPIIKEYERRIHIGLCR